MAAVTTLLALLKLDSSDYDKNLKKAKKDAKSFGGEIKKAGQNITNFGNKMTMATAPIALGLGYAINEARTFDKSMANVNAILGITGAEASDLRAELLAYGGDTRQGPQEIADAFYSIVSGVQDASTHMAILDAAVRTSDAGQADLTATTSALISTMNSYGFAAEDASIVSDVFTKTVGMGVLTMDELAAAMPQVTGLASSVGVSIQDLGSQMAFLTAQGFEASQSATFLKSMMTTLLSPTTDLQTAIEALGYDTGEAMLNNLGLVGSYEALKAYNNGTFAGLITNQEALQGATALTKDEFTAFNDTFQQTIDGSTDAAKAIQDEQAAYDLLGSKLQETAITIGTQLAPVIIALIDEAILPAVSAVTDWMTKNPELTQTLVLLTGAAVILGPIISGVGMAVQLMGGLMTAASAAAGVMGGSMMAAIGPIVAVGAAIAGVIHQLSVFNSQVQDAQSSARSMLSDEISSGQVSRQDLDDAAFGAVANEFGGGFFGDVAARLTYSNFSDSVAGDSNLISGNAPGVRVVGRADGGGVPAGSPMFQVNENGVEGWQSDSGGEVVPLGDPRHQGGGGVVINVYQRPGESGEMLADRIGRKAVQMGLARA